MTKETKAALLRDYKAIPPGNHIDIKWLWDVKPTETGSDVAYGALVYYNGRLLLDCTPDAPYKDYTPEEILMDILETLGYTCTTDILYTEDVCEVPPTN